MAMEAADPVILEAEGRKPRPFGLSARLIVLTILFVMLAEVLIYVPSVANFRRNWLNDRLAAAQIAALVLDAAPAGTLSDELERRLLEGVGAKTVAVRGGGTRRLLAASDKIPQVARMADLRRDDWITLIRDAFATLLAPAERPIRVLGGGMGGVDFVEIVINERPLREAMLDFSRNILLLSLLISGITAALVYLALQLVIVRPVRRLARNITAFAGNPEDASRVITPSPRSDEIGAAEQALARMETALAGEIRQTRRLADLGLAVSKINHELRNLLTTAQLLADRIDRVSDPAVQRVAPRLVATLDRAIAFCEATLAYGRASERPPQRQRIQLGPILAELPDLAAQARDATPTIEIAAPTDLVVDADADQLSRILINLVRNAVQALGAVGADGAAPRIRIGAGRRGGAVEITVEDNGPGLPPEVRAHLFEAFRSRARPGGTGLGLPIAAELARLHGGSLSLDETPAGTRFRLVIPDREG